MKQIESKHPVYTCSLDSLSRINAAFPLELRSLLLYDRLKRHHLLN